MIARFMLAIEARLHAVDAYLAYMRWDFEDYAEAQSRQLECERLLQLGELQ